MATIEVEIDLDDLTDVDRKDVLSLLHLHADLLRPADIAEMLDEEELGEIILEFLRGQKADDIQNLLEAAGYYERVLDDMADAVLIEELIRRTVDNVHDRDVDYLKKIISTRLATLNTEYAGFLEELLDMKRIRQDMRELAKSADAAPAN